MGMPEHVGRSYADAMTGATPQEVEQILEEATYVRLLYTHDWDYEWADDFRFWRKGAIERRQLMDMQRKLDPDFRLWNAHCPPNKRRLA